MNWRLNLLLFIVISLVIEIHKFLSGMLKILLERTMYLFSWRLILFEVIICEFLSRISCMKRKMQNVQKFVFLNQMKDIDHETAFGIKFDLKSYLKIYWLLIIIFPTIKDYTLQTHLTFWKYLWNTQLERLRLWAFIYGNN